MSKPRKFHMEPAFPPSHPGYQPAPLRIGKINGVPVFEIDGEAYCRLAHDPWMGEARRPK